MTMVEEMILSGFISKVVNEIVDVPLNPIKNMIKNADKNKRDKNQNIETRIYQVTIDSIKKYTNDKYKEQEILYDAAESIIVGLKSRNKIEAVKMGLKMLASQVTSETCEDFLKILQHEICIDKDDILYKEITLLQGEQTFETMHEGFNVSNKNDEKTHEKLEHVIEGINNIDKKIDRIENDETKHYEKPVENKAQYYADKWDKNVFLDDFDEEDERAGDRVNVKLKDIYLDELLPPYILNENQNLSYSLRARIEKYIVNKNDREMLLILGQAGIGKSTLITWIMANLVEKKDEIFVYQFASDLKKVDWQGEDILEEIFKALRLRDVELKDKVLILDGFDEISISGDRERILNKLSQEVEVKESLGNFSLIITCRENYVSSSYLMVKCYITLQAWNEDQIKNFCNVYEKKNIENLEVKVPETKISKILEKREIFGIPLILYMILALNIDVEKSSSIVDVYDQIFSVERGEIYNRCYEKEHRTNKPEIKKCIHRVSQKIAFWIFENNDDEEFIYLKNFKEICEAVMLETKDRSEEIQRDALIGNFFNLKHCEGKETDEVRFIHRSIYEYFVAVYFFESINKLTSKEEVAGKLGELLKDGYLSKQILEFIKYKFDSMRGYNLPDITKNIFNAMLRDGMTYHLIRKQKEPLLDILFREINIFHNMLEIVHLWNDKLGYVDKNIVVYLYFNFFDKLKLSGLNLEKADLRRVYLDRANLQRADLSGVFLAEASLRSVNLCKANLSGVNLLRANLCRANLSGANLSGANLSDTLLWEANLGGADLRGANLDSMDLSNTNFKEAIFDEKQVNKLYGKYYLIDSRVYISGTDEIIRYKEYRMRKQKEGI